MRWFKSSWWCKGDLFSRDSGDDQLTAETAGSSVINLNYQHRRQLCKILSCRLSRVFCNNRKLEVHIINLIKIYSKVSYNNLTIIYRIYTHWKDEGVLEAQCICDKNASFRWSAQKVVVKNGRTFSGLMDNFSQLLLLLRKKLLKFLKESHPGRCWSTFDLYIQKVLKY